LQLVGVNRGSAISDDSPQESFDICLAVVPSLAESEFPAALDSAQDGGFVGAPVEAIREAPTAIGPLTGLELAPDESLVGFHDTHQQGSLSLHHGRADAVAEIPRGLVTDPEHPLELVGADALLGLAHDVCG